MQNYLNFHREVSRKVSNLTSETSVLLEYRFNCSIVWFTWEFWGKGACLFTLVRFGYEASPVEVCEWQTYSRAFLKENPESSPACTKTRQNSENRFVPGIGQRQGTGLHDLCKVSSSFNEVSLRDWDTTAHPKAKVDKESAEGSHDCSIFSHRNKMVTKWCGNLVQIRNIWWTC